MSFQIVQVGDEELEFPSEMSDEDISKVLTQEFGSPATAPPPAPEATPEVIMPAPPPVTPPQESDEPLPVPGVSKDGVEGDILSDEGQRTNTEGLDIAYLDTKQNPTGGIGHLLTDEERAKYPEGTVIPRQVVEDWFLEDVAEAKVATQALIPDAPEEVKDIFTNMAFQLGRSGLKGFDKTIKLIKSERYSEASKEMLKSKWARKDTPSRAKRLAKRLEAFSKKDENMATIARQRSTLKLFSENPDLSFKEMVDGGVIDPNEDI